MRGGVANKSAGDDVEEIFLISDWALIRRLFRFAWRYRLRCLQVLFIQLILLSIGLTGLSLTGLGIDYIRHVLMPESVPLPGMRFLPALPEDGRPLFVLLAIAGAILALALMRAVLNYTYTVAISILVQKKMVVDLRGEIYSKLQHLSFRFFDANTTGSLITRVTGDVQAVRMFVDQVLIQCIIMVISLTIYTIFMVSLSPSLTIACLATTPLLALISVIFSKNIRPHYARNRRLIDRLVQYFAESIQGVSVIRAFGRSAENQARFEEKNTAVFEQQRGIFWRTSLFSPAVDSLTRINTTILLGFGGFQVIQGKLSLGAGLVVFAALLEQFSAQVNQIANLVNSVQRSLIGARRVFEVLDTPVDVESAPDAIHMPKFNGRVTFERVRFAHSLGSPVINDINLDITPGTCVAILGATGAGKSTLMSLIPRFFDPQEGRVLIDGIDVRKLHLDDLRRGIGLVFQESFLFSNTVAANIAFGVPSATQAQIEKAARIAAAHDFIMAMPQGYQTVLGEGGNSLSGGQRQRLAIARAILLEPAILLLDDPTASIDAQTEQEIFTALDNAITGRTTFIVAHRLSTLRRANLILVMENGRIVQKGTHEELLRRPGPYHRVAALQLRDGNRLSDSRKEELP